jgi:hypothetical protein
MAYAFYTNQILIHKAGMGLYSRPVRTKYLTYDQKF